MILNLVTNMPYILLSLRHSLRLSGGVLRSMFLEVTVRRHSALTQQSDRLIHSAPHTSDAPGYFSPFMLDLDDYRAIS